MVRVIANVRPRVTLFRRSVRRMLWSAALGAIVIVQSGCAAFTYVADRTDEVGHPILELGSMQHAQEGFIGEKTHLDGRDYLRVALPHVRQTCAHTAPLELLLPLSTQTQYAAILREGIHNGFSGPAVPVYGKGAAHPPGFTADTWSRTDARQWLTTLDLGAQPVSPVVIEHGPLGITTLYRLATDAQSRRAPTDVNVDWICRDRTKYVLLSTLYVPAIAFDVLTAPVVFGVLLIGQLVGPFIANE